MDLARGVQTRFTFGSSSNGSAFWSPDGARIAYASAGENSGNILVKAASGADNPELLLKSSGLKVLSDWSRDGRYILFSTILKGLPGSIWVLPLFGKRKPFPYLQTEFSEGGAVFSPDGGWVAYLSNESGSDEVYLSPFPAGGGKWQVSQGGGGRPQWRHDGSALYYLAPGGKLMEASVKKKGSAVEIGKPHELFQEPSVTEPGFAVAPDGKRFLIEEAEQSASPPITLVTNWTAYLKN